MTDCQVFCNCSSIARPKTLARRFQVKKDNENRGRWFFSCNSCKFFKWENNGPSLAAPLSPAAITNNMTTPASSPVPINSQVMSQQTSPFSSGLIRRAVHVPSPPSTSAPAVGNSGQAAVVGWSSGQEQASGSRQAPVGRGSSNQQAPVSGSSQALQAPVGGGSNQQAPISGSSSQAPVGGVSCQEPLSGRSQACPGPSIPSHYSQSPLRSSFELGSRPIAAAAHQQAQQPHLQSHHNVGNSNSNRYGSRVMPLSFTLQQHSCLPGPSGQSSYPHNSHVQMYPMQQHIYDDLAAVAPASSTQQHTSRSAVAGHISTQHTPQLHDMQQQPHQELLKQRQRPALAGLASATHSSSDDVHVGRHPASAPADEEKIHVKVKLQIMSKEEMGASFPYSEAVKSIVMSLDKQVTQRRWDPAERLWKFALSSYQLVLKAFESAGCEVEKPNEHVLNALLNNTEPGIGAKIHLQQSPVPSSSSGIVKNAPLSFHEAEQVMKQHLTPTTLGNLFNFQWEGVRFIVSRQGRALLADEPGLGKTVQAVCAAACFPESFPLLVVCPSSMRYVWKAALHDWLPDALVPVKEDLWVLSSGKDVSRVQEKGLPSTKAHACITSYDLIQKLDKDLSKVYGFVIVDESHCLKSRDAKRTQFLSKLVKASRHAVLLTGTPLLSKPIEVFPQIDMLQPGLLGTYREFGERYCVNPGGPPASSNRFNSPGHFPGQEYRGAANLHELSMLLQSTVMIRRTKAEVAGQLPDKIRQRVLVSTDTACSKQLAEIRGRMVALDAAAKAGDLRDQHKEREQLVNEYYRASGPAKVKEAVEFLKCLLDCSSEEAGRKVLVFCHHQAVMDAIEQKLLKASPNLGYIRIDGSTSDIKRKEYVDKFQRGHVAAAMPSLSAEPEGGCSGSRSRSTAEESGDEDHQRAIGIVAEDKARVALLSITAAGVGLTLTAAEVCVFVELYWNPSILLQAEDRAHRLGQKRTVMVYYLHASGTCDDIIWPLVNKKLQVVGRTLGEDAAAPMSPSSQRSPALSPSSPVMKTNGGASLSCTTLTWQKALEDAAEGSSTKGKRSDNKLQAELEAEDCGSPLRAGGPYSNRNVQEVPFSRDALIVQSVTKQQSSSPHAHMTNTSTEGLEQALNMREHGEDLAEVIDTGLNMSMRTPRSPIIRSQQDEHMMNPGSKRRLYLETAEMELTIEFTGSDCKRMKEASVYPT
ncbi:hypothetical protein CEUSTIGMA_g6001.t1 [Chlamydomonas eustigma]|uniref:Uncharacterized protein n=1 Tax=Chlamydomonas eustigma TaxID=1157962 RepID=A0A250X659_9CHLO|nr:hypothetical protein CEUSTIGMA_g6001.t1 [Chlamydomonas eustigma]|eukprot:GAX78561.1 hypothetical protein CEUSTIGMA_g6001.t1 [Chlamydomonas eustigma]